MGSCRKNAPRNGFRSLRHMTQHERFGYCVERLESRAMLYGDLSSDAALASGLSGFVASPEAKEAVFNDFTTSATAVTVPDGQTQTDSSIRTGNEQVIKRGGGVLILDKSNSHSGGTVIDAGEVIIRNVAALGTGFLDVRAGAKATLDLGSANWNAGTNYVSLSGLALDSAGSVDIGAGQIRVPQAGYDLASIRAAISSGRSGGTWAGSSGIVSTVAGTIPARAVGYGVGGNGTLIVGLAAFGDLNVDGYVDFDDTLGFVSAGLYDTGLAATWGTGDFDYNGVVDFDDVLAMVSAGLHDQGSYLPQEPVVYDTTITVLSGKTTVNGKGITLVSTSGSSLSYNTMDLVGLPLNVKLFVSNTQVALVTIMTYYVGQGFRFKMHNGQSYQGIFEADGRVDF